MLRAQPRPADEARAIEQRHLTSDRSGAGAAGAGAAICSEHSRLERPPTPSPLARRGSKAFPEPSSPQVIAQHLRHEAETKARKTDMVAVGYGPTFIATQATSAHSRVCASRHSSGRPLKNALRAERNSAAEHEASTGEGSEEEEAEAEAEAEEAEAEAEEAEAEEGGRACQGEGGRWGCGGEVGPWAHR